MFGIGAGEMVVIAVVLILVVGPERMPGMMRNLGKGMRQLRQKSQELRDVVGIDQLLYDDPPPQPLPPLAPPPQPPVAHLPEDAEAEDKEEFKA